jgi:hypothetical protein
MKRFPWGKLIAACLLIGLLGSGGCGVYWFVQPRGTVEGQVLRQVDNQPLANVELQVEGTNHAVRSSADGMVRLD